jgi:hypothetical protein
MKTRFHKWILLVLALFSINGYAANTYIPLYPYYESQFGDWTYGCQLFDSSDVLSTYPTYWIRNYCWGMSPPGPSNVTAFGINFNGEGTWRFQSQSTTYNASDINDDSWPYSGTSGYYATHLYNLIVDDSSYGLVHWNLLCWHYGFWYQTQSTQYQLESSRPCQQNLTHL